MRWSGTGVRSGGGGLGPVGLAVGGTCWRPFWRRSSPFRPFPTLFSMGSVRGFLGVGIRTVVGTTPLPLWLRWVVDVDVSEAFVHLENQGALVVFGVVSVIVRGAFVSGENRRSMVSVMRPVAGPGASCVVVGHYFFRCFRWECGYGDDTGPDLPGHTCVECTRDGCD